ncbi:hypothetical protein GJ699_33670 [Duganella sp. FT80W]|uniref:DUF2924 domain-containing protein n=1 Tax=Duganella guangzhouensis TaxID=2666084 RepID=A0A6I2LF93_9BURK|nr:hypothetical protein [Duganella guangzhouensis]MRW94909.1 hypothetical protein [Duganella guangzhouensis]
MNTLTMPLRIPADLLVELGEYTGLFWSSMEQEPHICAAIRAYINPAPPVQEAATRSDIGYQWKQLFLPAGTRLRASFRRQHYFASVEGGEILCDGQSVSPSSFANLRGSGNRNAWKAVWLRFPGSPQWVLADECRTLQKAATARLFNADADDEAANTPPAAPQRPAPRPTPASAAADTPAAAARTPAAPGKKKTRRGKRRHQRNHNA